MFTIAQLFKLAVPALLFGSALIDLLITRKRAHSLATDRTPKHTRAKKGI